MSNSHKHVDHVLMSSAHVTGIGGVQVVLRNLVHGLEDSGRRVTFVQDAALPQLTLRQTTNAIGCRVFVCPMPSVVRNSAFLSAVAFIAYLPISLFHLVRLIRRERIDVINGHYLDAYFIHLVIAARFAHIPMVVSVHGADVDAYAGASFAERLFYRLIVRGATRVSACSEALAREMVRVFPSASQKTEAVHNGLDLSTHPHAALPPEIPRPFVLCVSRHVRKKGIDVLLRAFARIADEAAPHALVLVGDGPLLDEHKALATSLGIGSRVVFVGSVQHADVEAFFEASSLVAVPSRAEPFGLVILEAARSRKPIIATRVGGIPEILTDGFDGVLVEPDDAHGLGAQLLNLLGRPALAAQLGSQAHETLLARFQWKDRVAHYLDLLADALNPVPRNAGRRASPVARAVGE